MQGWSAVLFYAYAQESLTQVHAQASVYQISDDPALTESLAAAALLFRDRHVAESPTTYQLDVGERQLFYGSVSAASSVAIRTAAERGRLAVAMPSAASLPWLMPSVKAARATMLHDPGVSQVPLDSARMVSDSGELMHDWRQGVATIDTARSQSAMGELCCEQITLSDVQLKVDGSPASVAIQSLDGTPIHASHRLLVSVIPSAVASPGDTLPFTFAPLNAQISVRAPAGLIWQGINCATRLGPQGTRYRGGRYQLTIGSGCRRLIGTPRHPSNAIRTSAGL
jgi:hypothetical protein